MPPIAPAQPDLLASSAAQSMMPGLAHLAIDAPRTGAMAIDAELHMANLIAALQRVKKTDPGSGDLAFIASLRGKRPASLALADRERVQLVAVKYRAQLPEGLRPPPKPPTF